MDEFVTKARKDIHLGNLALNCIHNHTGETAHDLGLKLLASHRPFKIDYRKKFGIGKRDGKRTSACPTTATRECDACRKAVTNAEVDYCLSHKDRFAGSVLCRKCQSYAPSPLQDKSASKPHYERAADHRCAECGASVDGKVWSFCRLNRNRFDNRILCRQCQTASKKHFEKGAHLAHGDIVGRRVYPAA